MRKKAKYVSPKVVTLWFEASDIITESSSEFDGVGYIPDDWFVGWNAVYGGR